MPILTIKGLRKMVDSIMDGNSSNEVKLEQLLALAAKPGQDVDVGRFLPSFRLLDKDHQREWLGELALKVLRPNI